MLMFNAMGKGRAFHTSCNSYFMFCVVAKYILQFAEINLNLVVLTENLTFYIINKGK